MARPHPALVGFLRRYLAALVAAVAVFTTAIVGVNVAIDHKIGAIPTIEGLKLDDQTGAGEPANFLLIGSDSRQFVGDDPGLEQAFGSPQAESGQRSDTLIVVHVDPKAKSALLVSFPRDLYVNIPGVGMSKINAAYNYGPQKVIDTIQQDFDIPIQHYMEVGFLGFRSIVDALGGITMYVDAPARDLYTGLEIGHFGPGCYTIDGETALAYVRSRHYQRFVDGSWKEDPTADLGRITRQQQFLRRLAKAAVDVATKSPTKAANVADAALKFLQVDSGFGRADINKLIRAFRTIDPNDPASVEMLTVPLKPGSRDVPRVGNVVEVDPGPTAQLMDRLRGRTEAPPVVRPGDVRVRVLNGSGVSGIALSTLKDLQQHGFNQGGVGDAPRRLDQTELRYRATTAAKAELVRQYLGGVGRLVQDDSIVEADVVVTIGRDFKGVAPPGQTPTTAPATTVAPTTTSRGTATTTTTVPKQTQTEC